MNGEGGKSRLRSYTATRYLSPTMFMVPCRLYRAAAGRTERSVPHQLSVTSASAHSVPVNAAFDKLRGCV